MRSTTVAIACATLCAAWSASATHADIVHFVNPAPGQPGHYPWAAGDVGSPSLWLDVTLSPALQTNLPNGRSVQQLLEIWDGGAANSHGTLFGPQILAFPRSDHWIPDETYFLSAGDPVEPSAQGEFSRSWSRDSIHVALNGGAIWSRLPLGATGYIGVLTVGGNLGWIRVVNEASADNLSLRALAWAYETVPGAPIAAGQVPSPGAAAMVWAGVIVMSTRRRRS